MGAYTLTEVQENVIKNDINSDIFAADMQRRLDYNDVHGRYADILQYKYQQCFKRLKKEWDPKLIAREIEIPTDPDEYAAVVFAEDDYKDRAARDSEQGS